MATITFTLRSVPEGRLDLGGLVPAHLAGQAIASIERIALRPGREAVHVGDVFKVSGGPIGADDTVIIGGHGRFDEIGAGLASGSVRVEGDAGAFAGTGVKGGRLDISGSAGPFLACGQRGGLVTVQGGAGDGVGAMRDGHRYGMLGGLVHVGGDCGARTGDRMRRGTIVIRGRAGASAGSRMMGGTIIAEGGFAAGPGPLLRRGTLIGPKVEALLPTFADCGRHDLMVMRLVQRYLAEALGELAPKLPAGPVRRLMGDLATIGKGEILLTG
jgi:formylmethanofuran dehydrogenase subunit C